MKQGFLFEPEAIARTELQDAIARLDFHAAARKLEEFHRAWPEAKLTWEPELVRAGSMLAAKPLNLDSGYQAWQKLEARMNGLDISRSWTASMQRNFFSRLLAANRSLFEGTNTAAGHSLGDFYLLAGQPRNARRRFETEIRQTGDGWKVRLQLGNCDFRLGHGPVAHSNYHWSFVLGLPKDSWALVEDSGFLARLRAAEEAEWAFPELCTAGELLAARFSSRSDFNAFKLQFAAAITESPAPRRFCLYWIISENKPFCSDSELLDARRQLKALHPRLHARYMQRLDQGG